MKDLELTVYPIVDRIPDGPGNITRIYGTEHGGIYDWQAERMAKAKRLTNAELAAECYRQMTRAIRESGIAELPGDMIAPGDAVTFGPHRLETQRLGALHRFATLPHYDEVPE